MRTNIPKDWFHNGKPLAIDLPCFWRVYLRYHLLGQGLVGWLDKDGQMFATRFGVLQTLLAPQTCTAIRFICLLSTVEVVPNFGPTSF